MEKSPAYLIQKIMLGHLLDGNIYRQQWAERKTIF